MILIDSHMHSVPFSHDAHSTTEEMINSGINKGLKALVFTNHFDKDNFDYGDEEVFDVEEYFKTLKPLQEKYKDKIDVRIGIELGFNEKRVDYYNDLLAKYPFDFVIGSNHETEGHDVATKVLFKDRSDREAYRIAFEDMLNKINSGTNFDSLGHLDYVTRYGSVKGYTYSNFEDIIDEILKAIIHKGKGIEINTAGIRYGIGFCHPKVEVLMRYRELGGEIITVGSDAHKVEDVAADFKLAGDLLQQCGFKYYSDFKGRILHMNTL
ncbi:MAG: histidinol-phosphatase HisJ family protein [Lachnospiraceae bacterium]|jgi:histidinol-phosphatase (PHP family)|nr:histidinol-phosphatase HisJ family protein [Lachnospiraceae bacterium]